MTTKDILPLIPCKGQSEGLPGKHLLPLPNGKTVLQHAIAEAKKVFGWALVSTDDEALAQHAGEAGADVTEQTPGDIGSYRVVAEVLERYPDYQAVMLLQATQPFRSADMIIHAQSITERPAPWSAIISVARSRDQRWPLFKVTHIWPIGAPWASLPNRRQEAWTLYVRDGSIYLSRAETIRKGSLYGATVLPLVLSDSQTANIDTPEGYRDAIARWPFERVDDSQERWFYDQLQRGSTDLRG